MSGNTWSASVDARSLDELQKMRQSGLTFEEHKQRLSSATKSASRASSSIHSAQSARAPRRAQSMPPRNRKLAAGGSKPAPVSRPKTTSTTIGTSSAGVSSGKVWIKPEPVNPVATTTDLDSFMSNINGQESAIPNDPASSNGVSSPPSIQSGPVRITDIKSPEELSGIKSPPPENWLISVDQKTIDWTNSNQSARTAALPSNDLYDNLLDTYGSVAPTQSSAPATDYSSSEQPLLSGI